MRRWRKDNNEDVLKFEDSDDDDDDDRYRRPMRRSSYSFDNDHDDDATDDSIAIFDRLAPLVRSGEYKPKQSDPYTLHVLYQSLIHFGDL